MRNVFFGMAVVLLVRSVWSDCSDTTIVLKSGTTGFTSGSGSSATATYDPTALNAMIHVCAAGAMTVRLNIDATESGKTKDTVKLIGPILIGGRVGKTTSLTMDRPGTIPAGVMDTLFTFTENSTTNPSLLVDSTGNTLVLSRMAFARKVLNQDSSSVNIMADGSSISGCQFWMADKDAILARAALLNIVANSVLVERSLFRAPPTVNGFARGIRWGGTVVNLSKLEVRANVFFGTGLFLSANGPFHVIANTFAGSRNQYNPIIIGGAIGTNFDNAVIMHNLFALKIDTIPPIVFNSPPSAVTTDSILRNAWTQGKSGLALAVTEPVATGIKLNGATAGNVNLPLPRGFSNYGPNAGDVKDYPLTELRTDSTLARKSPDFGKVYRVFLTGSWAGTPVAMSDISTLLTKTYFPGFAPFLSSKTWLANVKVGAFVDQDTITIPSPLAAGVQGASLKMQPDSSGSDKAKITSVTFDQNYYGQTLLPEYAYFFFSNTLAKLTTSNDTTALIASVGQPQRKQWTGFDNILTVPKEVRNGPNVDIYVKMLHFRGSFMAAVQSNAAIATLSNFPGFPANDLTLTVLGSNSLNKTVDLKVTRLTEQIDSIRILTLNEGGQQVASKSFAVGASQSITPTITVTDKGRYFFQAVPVASLGGGVFKAGSPTPSSVAVDIGLTSSDSVYVTYTATCPGADGTFAKPYCLLDSALKVVAAKSASTIIISNGTIPMTDITIDSVLAPGSSNITITALPPAAGKIDDNRPVFLGDKKEALTIARRNVTVRGFLIEQPAAGSKAGLAVNAGGCLIDGNIFRAHTKGSVEAQAITVAVGSTADVRIINNVVWGFAKGVQLSSTSSPNLIILFNTFVADTALNKTTTSGISTSSSDDVAAIVADNFFSGLTDPIDVSLALKHPILDHNVYTAGANLHGLSESGGLGASTPVSSSDIDIWVPKYATATSNALHRVVDCSSLAPCNPLYGGSSANDYNVTVGTDAFAQPRKNRKEVGAYEYPSAPSGVLGVVEINPSLVKGTFRKISYTVSGKSFDPDPQETDSVQVFWLTSDVTGSIDQNLTPIPSSQHKKYPISKLVSGNITDTADGILDLRKYWFYAALSRYSSGRAMGYAYSDTIISSPNVQDTDCNFSESKKACPSETGVFGVDTGAWTGKFVTTVLLTQATDSAGLVKVPRFVSVTNTSQYGLDLSSPLPMFYLDASVKGLGVADSKQRLIWEVQVYGNLDLSGLDLFLLPSDSTGKPTLVPDWSINPLGGGKFSIVFESTINGPQVYAFGKLQASPGMAVQSDPRPPLYDFDVARDSVYHVAFHIKGAGFKTANPLVLISAIPAGGTIYLPAGSSIPKVISEGYPIRTIVASSGYSGVSDSLRMARMHDLYLKAVAAQSADLPNGPKRPFHLDSLTPADFSKAVDTLKDGLDVSGGEMNVPITFSKFYNNNSKYPDQVGKATRSVEVVITVFDGSKISQSRGFIRTRFRNRDIQSSEFYNKWKWFMSSSHDSPHWNLFGFPWDESESASLARILGKDKWDQDNMRLLQYLGTGEGSGAFTAYDGTNASAFKYDSGMAVWSGSTNGYLPTSDSGMSLDFQPFVMSLAPNRYYDISMPFNFPMKWQDVLDSSGLTGLNAPAMWRYNDTASKWVAVQAGTASPPTPGPVLYPWEGYTIKTTSAQTLTFPVADTTRTSKATAKVAASSDGSWAVFVEARDATAAMDLRIGRGAREILFPEAPNVPGQDFRISLLKGEDKVSQYIQSLDGGVEGNWALQAVSAKGSGGIALRIGEATRDIPVWLVDATHANAVPLSKTQSVSVSEGDLKTNDYHLVAGDKDYLDRIMQSLVPGHLLTLSNYPNPFSASTLIRYSLPAAFGRTTFDLKVRDFRGRTVWEKTIESGNSLNFTWDGHDRTGMPLPAGIYNLSLTTKSEGKPAYRAQRNLLRM